MNEKDWQSFLSETDSVKQAMLLAKVTNDASEKADRQNKRLWIALSVSVLVNLIGVILAVCLTIYMQAHAQEMLNTGLETALQGKTNDILAAVNNNNQVLGNAVCQLGYQTAQNFARVERQMAECCCNIERGIDGVNYNVASQAAAINANTTAGIQKVLDAITGNRMADMQNQINQLQLQAAMCGVVRYPTATTYATTCNPFFGGYSCGCANGAY